MQRYLLDGLDYPQWDLLEVKKESRYVHIITVFPCIPHGVLMLYFTIKHYFPHIVYSVKVKGEGGGEEGEYLNS